MTETLSRRKRIIALLGALPTVRSNLRSRPEHTGNNRGPGSVTLLEEHPGFTKTDSEGNPLYPFAALELALSELKRLNSRAYGAVWRVYCEGQPATSVQLCKAHIGLKQLESSPYLPSYVRLPKELLLMQARPSSHEAKKEQNKWIRELRSEGRSQREIASMVGVTQQRIAQILQATQARAA